MNRSAARDPLVLTLLAALFAAAAAAAAVACGGGGGSGAVFAFTSAPAVETSAGAAYAHQFTVAGASGPVTFTLLSGPAGLTVSSGGLVQWTPSLADLGTHAVSVQASDGTHGATRAWNLRVHQGIDLGVTLSPRGHTTSSTQQDFVAHLDPARGTGRLRAFHGRWRDAVTGDGEIPALGQVAGGAAAAYGFALAMGFGWADGAGAPDLTSESEPANNSWTNLETRAEFQAMVTAFAASYRPAYLFLGNETNSYFVTHSQAEWDAWTSELEACYDAIKAASPGTIVFTTFQLELLKGGGAKNGWSWAAQWQLVDALAASGAVDAIGFTTYPYFDYDDPADIPAAYFDEIASHWSGPVVFTEIGWLAAPGFPYPGGEADQAAFVGAFFARTAGLELRYAVWLFEHDWDGQAGQAAFANIGLRSNDGGTVRAADAAWRAEVALRQR